MPHHTKLSAHNLIPGIKAIHNQKIKMDGLTPWPWQFVFLKYHAAVLFKNNPFNICKMVPLGIFTPNFT